MKFLTKTALAAHQSKALGLERDLLAELISSRNFSRRVSTLSLCLGLFCVAGLGYTIHRYAQPIPEHILTINMDTGEINTVSLLTEQKTYGEVIDQYWVGQYVLHHEGYDYYTLQQDYDAVSVMSSPVVAGDYAKLFSGNEAMDRKLQDSMIRTVHLVSVILDRENQIATVRYTTQDKYANRSIPEEKKHWIATVAYSYQKTVLTASQRFLNPLGFQVTSFKAQPEAANAGE
ncbi:virB8 family protein [Entomobacter blattae]|uniref:Type IV secretion system protein virB8 n=1 Tax=Entomobacter blattae TaxID=2762277 RepID=A0A7H1NRP3_9PROT|nr:type IV secretion system protein [Entomobacter blattae]QNT77565.1 Type IV secretion system protein virB8 [Entomobacter blattae]QNT78453.1 Type IV secretion system protein virB8 [Entomobacter blattae]